MGMVTLGARDESRLSRINWVKILLMCKAIKYYRFYTLGGGRYWLFGRFIQVISINISFTGPAVNVKEQSRINYCNTACKVQ